MQRSAQLRNDGEVVRLLLLHVDYRHPGGEEAVVETEGELLSAQSNLDVTTVRLASTGFDDLSYVERVAIAAEYPIHSHGRLLVRKLVEEYEPDVVHFHNLHPLLGVGAVMMARELGCGVVRTLHNYRLWCIAGTHLRRGAVCEDCVGRRGAWGVLHKCYRGSYLQSIVMSRGAAEDIRQTVSEGAVDVFVCVNDLQATRLLETGFPAERVIVKPNTVGMATCASAAPREGACFIGRLSPEKGIVSLAEAWTSSIPLTIVGDGPSRGAAEARAGSSVRFEGALTPREVMRAISSSRVLVVPSLWYEGDPRVVAEALACGTPVVVYEHLAVSERLRRSGCALVAPSGEVARMVDLALSLCEMGEADWRKISRAATLAYASYHSPAAAVRCLNAGYAVALRRGLERRGRR